MLAAGAAVGPTGGGVRKAPSEQTGGPGDESTDEPAAGPRRGKRPGQGVEAFRVHDGGLSDGGHGKGGIDVGTVVDASADVNVHGGCPTLAPRGAPAPAGQRAGACHREGQLPERGGTILPDSKSGVETERRKSKLPDPKAEAFADCVTCRGRSVAAVPPGILGAGGVSGCAAECDGPWRETASSGSRAASSFPPKAKPGRHDTAPVGGFCTQEFS